MAARLVFGDKCVALPEKFGGDAVDGFADTSAERVIAVAGGLAVRPGDFDQPVLAVITVFREELLAFATAFLGQVAEGVVGVVAVALDQQAVAGDDVGAGAVLHQQVAGRVVGETFLHVVGMVGAGQALQRVVAVVVFAFAGVEQAGEVAGSVVVVLALVERMGLVGDGVGVQALLVVVVIVAEQLALLALVFQTGVEQVRCQGFAI